MALKKDGQQGQTLVEYMLLLAVVVSLVLTFYNSQLYKRLFGNKGELVKGVKEESEFNYRQALPRTKEANQPAAGERDVTLFPSYRSQGDTRFFGPKDPYP